MLIHYSSKDCDTGLTSLFSWRPVIAPFLFATGKGDFLGSVMTKDAIRILTYFFSQNVSYLLKFSKSGYIMLKDHRHLLPVPKCRNPNPEISFDSHSFENLSGNYFYNIRLPF